MPTVPIVKGRSVKDHPRDRVFRACINSRFRLVKTDSEGRENYILDTKDERVGYAYFDRVGHFTGGKLYDTVVVKGRTKNTQQALSEFEIAIEEFRVVR